MMKSLQKLGKALMLPVAVLPICGILMGIGYALSPNAMQGGAIEGALEIIGFFLIKAGGALIDNMAILFAIGVGVGLAEGNDGASHRYNTCLLWVKGKCNDFTPAYTGGWKL